MSCSTRSAQLREQLGYPVIDADGHNVEYMPTVLEYIAEFGGGKVADRFRKPASFVEYSQDSLPNWYELDEENRRRFRLTRPVWWSVPTCDPKDFATTMLPRLFEERLGEFGIDFAVVYPTRGLAFTDIPDHDARVAACRGLNAYQAEIFAPYAKRMTPAAVIPMVSPTEALEELEFAIGSLGLKTTMMAGHVQRAVAGSSSNGSRSTWIDTLGIDSAFDYDIVWRRCRELHVAPAFHSGSMGWGTRTSPSNYMYNHIGHFAAASEGLCRALWFGGVCKRFPDLPFMFLEAGVGWAVSLLNDLVGHWEKRNGSEIWAYDPDNLDRESFADLFCSYAPDSMLRHIGEIDDVYTRLRPGLEDKNNLDEFANAGCESSNDIVAQFVSSFYFGCEADDPLVGLAFRKELCAGGGPLRATFSSDIGHWDVRRPAEVLEEAWELVDKGLVTEAEFKAFVCGHSAELLTRANGAFFSGTTLEGIEEGCR